MMLLDSIRSRFSRFMLGGLIHRHYLILQEKVEILERENALQKRYIRHLEGGKPNE